MTDNNEMFDELSDSNDFLSSNKHNYELSQFFKTMHKGIRLHGIKKITKVVQSIDLEDENLYFIDILNFIFVTVADEFGITIEELKGKDSRGEATTARKLAIILAKENVDVSNEFLASEFNRVRQVVYGIIKEYKSYKRRKDYSPNEKEMQEFFRKYDKLNRKIDTYISELKKY